MTAVLWICFALSGAAALALELLWMRSAGLVLGQTATTTATVLACYFGGLAGGAALARRVGAQALRTYGRLELGAALGALWSVGVFSLVSGDGAQHWLASGRLAGMAAVLVAVLPATLCFGATLPALGQALTGRVAAAPRVAALYALNTLGGGLGIAAAGFGLPVWLGVRASYLAVAACSAFVGLVALGLARRGLGVDASLGPASARLAPRWRLRLVAAGVGGLGLGLEIFWTRLFAQVLHNSVYSFAAIALVYLVALALGAAVAAIALRRANPVVVAALALLIAAATTVSGFWLFVGWTDGLAYLGMHSGLSEYLLRIVWLAAATAGPAACASGAVLPALWAAWGSDERLARPLGDLSAANMLGGIAGALAAGFVALPTLGLRGALLCVAVVYVVLAHVIAPHRTAWLRPLGYLTLLAVALAAPLRAPLVHLRPGDESLRDLREGPGGIVSVVQTADDLQLRLDNFYVLGGSAAAVGERRLGLLPLLLHPDPHSAAFIGLATGISASAAPALGVADTRIIELLPEVAAAARQDFGALNGELLLRPDVHLIVDDGRRALAADPRRFDVIVSDLFVPWHAGAGSLYTQEMYATVASRLAPGGLFCQWLPLYQLTREEFALIARTFSAVFPVTTLWRADFYPDRPVVGLVGQLAPRALDLTAAADRLARLPDWARDPLLAAPRALLMLSAGDLAHAGDLLPDGELNRDDRPRLEFDAPRLTRLNAAGDKDWFTGAALADFYDGLATRGAASPDPIVGQSPGAAEARRAGTLLYRYALAAAAHDADGAARYAAAVRGLVPEVVASADAANASGTLADAQRELAGLRAQQDAVRARLTGMEQQLHELSATRKDTP
ncbi:MAG: fused MFS/spermidine synthase [bacterium]